MTSGRLISDGVRRGGLRGRWVSAVGALWVLSAASFTPSMAWAQTKTCGTPVEPTACPQAAPIITPWAYRLGGTYGMGTSPDYSSIEDATNWFISKVTPPAGIWCTAPYAGYGTPWGISYVWDIEYSWEALAYFNATGYTTDPTPCQQHWQGDSYLSAQRQVSCPEGMTGTYSAGPPVVGPYCKSAGPV